MAEIDYAEALRRIQGVYSSCSELEKKELMKIIQEVSIKGYSETLETLWLSDFKEVPVSIDEFICNNYYMGQTNRSGEAVYPYWRQTAHNIFGSGNKYSEIILSGATRIGKTSTMTVILAYMLYRLMLYRNPHEYFKKKEVSRFTIAFANLTMELAQGVCYREFNDTLKECPWFQDHGTFSRSQRNFYYIPEGDKIEIVAGSDASMFLGRQIWAAGIDECNFAKAGVKDIGIAKATMKKLYDTINARVSGTFRLHGEVYGKMITSSSKNTDSDFLSDHIETQLNSGNSSLYLVDEPQWKILPPEMFSDEVFHFTVGDRYKRGFVIPEQDDDEEHRKEYEAQGYRIVEAPAELRKSFLADYDIALRDIAGISVVGSMGFIHQEIITPCVSLDRHNPFYQDILEIGKQDNKTIEEFFHLEAVPAEFKRARMDIHLDMAETSDRSGISGVCVAGSKIVEDFSGKKISMPMLKQVFQVGISAPRGDRQSFQKVVNFLVWLQRQNFNIGVVSADQYQSAYMLEMLESKGFKTAKVSVDRTTDPYVGLKNLLYDQCLELVKHQVQENELVHLQRQGNKIDHPLTNPDGTKGGKDCADALCGACWTLVTDHVQPTASSKSVASAIRALNGPKTYTGAQNQLNRFMPSNIRR